MLPGTNNLTYIAGHDLYWCDLHNEICVFRISRGDGPSEVACEDCLLEAFLGSDIGQPEIAPEDAITYSIAGKDETLLRNAIELLGHEHEELEDNGDQYEYEEPEELPVLNWLAGYAGSA